LSSFGIAEYGATLEKVGADPKRKGGAKSHRVRNGAKNALERIEWHKGKNELMASRKYHEPGADEQASRIMNLLEADDVSYRHFALDRISHEKIRDPRVYKMLAEQIARFTSNVPAQASRQQDNLIAANIKLLGLSGDGQYRSVIEGVIASGASAGVKKHAEVALNRLL
jgi:hypothetical protein